MKTKKFPRMYALTKLGNVKWYEIEVIPKDFLPRIKGAQMICRKATSLTAKVQTDVHDYKEGKNIGRSNETTPFQQAVSEAESSMSKLRDEGYTETMPEKGAVHNTDAQGAPKPMLAQKFPERKDKITYPVLVQPKLDGCRALCRIVNGEVVFTSRNGKVINTLGHIENDVKASLSDGVLDGELYIHKESFQTVIRAIKKLNADSPRVQYRVYDLAMPDETMQDRHLRLQKVVQDIASSFVEIVPTYTCVNEGHVLKKFSQFLERGYEGAMIRTMEGEYEFGFRSKHLLKLKEFEEAEYEIIDVEEATGRDKGTAVFVCKVKTSGKNFIPFNVRPVGTYEQRQQYLTDKKKLIGKQLTVQYQGVSEDSIPRFPVGKIVRDYE